MQTWFSAGIDICLAILFGYYLIENQVKSYAYVTIQTIKKTCSILAIAFLIGYVILATINITQSKISDLWPNTLAVIRLTSLGNMVFLAILASLLILFLNFIKSSATQGIGNKFYLLGILILAYAKAYIGHAADYGLIHWAVINHTIHILAGCAWAGSVIASILLLPYWQKLNLKESRDLAYRLSAIATIAVPITLICGVIDSLRILYGQDNVWGSAYLITLTIKVILVVIAILLGLVNRWYWMPKIDNKSAKQSFIYTISIESIALIIVLLAAAQLSMTMIPG